MISNGTARIVPSGSSAAIATVSKAQNIKACNATIYIVDTVLLPSNIPPLPPAKATLTPGAEGASRGRSGRK